jgi:phosphomannomutase
MRVVDIGVATTPTVGVMVERLGALGGLVLTASHNPAEWNGLKALALDEGAKGRCRAPAAADAQRIVDRFRADAPLERRGRGRVERDESGAERHVERVLEALGRVAPIDAIRRRKVRVTVDSVNASGARGAAMLLERLGCEVEQLHGDGSGVFPHAPEPTRENLVEMCRCVAEGRSDVGFAQDPDADRLAIVDERGAYIGEEHTLVLAAMALLPRTNGASVAVNLSTSRMIDDVGGQFGARVVRTAVGEANVVTGMLRERCVMGGEGNGGVIWPEVTMIRDSLGAMGLTLALMAREGAAVSALAARVPAYVIEKRKAPVREGLAGRASEAIAARFAGHAIDRQDGVRVSFAPGSDLGGREGAWLHVRASNTEPILRLIAEAGDAARARSLLDEAAGVVAGLR